MNTIQAPYLIYLGDVSIAELAKTGAGLVYWRPERCIGQLKELGCKADLGIPDMSIQDAAAAGAKTLVIGVAVIGGELPEHWVARLVEAMEAGLDIAAGLHDALAEHPVLAAAAEKTGQKITDVRKAGGPWPIANGLPREGRRLLTVGTDCAVGKKYTALSIHQELVKLGQKATFRATGQTGVLIDGHGLAADAIVSDFLAGAIESLTPANDADHWDIVEGQGAIVHPAYAGVTLGLLHGSQPDAVVLCHEVGREELSGFKGISVGDPQQVMDLIIALGQVNSPNIKFVGISLNTSSLKTNAEAHEAIDAFSQKYNLPAFDPVRFGSADFVKQLIEMH